jgi:hypothetical protein
MEVVEARTFVTLEVSPPSNVGKGEGDMRVEYAKSTGTDNQFHPPRICLMWLHPQFVICHVARTGQSQHRRLGIAISALKVKAMQAREVSSIQFKRILDGRH